MFKKPKETKYNLISLGAGVQSSVMALMAAREEIKPMPDAAIFADTQAEPSKVYEYLNWIKEELPFPVHIVSHGDLKQIKIVTSKKGYKYVESMVPGYTTDDAGKKGMVQRRCTKNYKIDPIARSIRNTYDIKYRRKEIQVTQWIGISLDEVQRMKDSNYNWMQNRWPLLEKGMTRSDCLSWIKKNNFKTPPKSACFFCPYMKDSQWIKLQKEDPESFENAIKFEKEYNEAQKEIGSDNNIYLHPSRIPLDQVDFKGSKNQQLEIWQDFNNECEGMCGL